MAAMISVGLNQISRVNLLQKGLRSNRSFSSVKRGKDEGSLHIVRAGLPLILFCGLGVWVVSNGIEGKNKERDAFQGRMSK